jgi:SAM-dependent methyltransferase
LPSAVPFSGGVSQGLPEVCAVTSEKNRALFNEYAKAAAPDDFWMQVRRTVRGEPVDEAQIEIIVAALVDGLALARDDIVLDLCCGNGALTDRIFERCRGGLGVDFAENLIDVARANFERLPDRIYTVGDVVDFAAASDDTVRFTKAMCYGSFPYLSDDAARSLLTTVRRRYPGIARFAIGNLPDKLQLHAFYDPDKYVPGIESDHESPIGIWRSEDEFRALAAATGWQAAFHHMPAEFYAARYRYDVVLTPL